ncbi:hypothetical protein [Leptospira bandrabouensis]|uniref:hypothetical protein n=1 Tax=Leptospira bandrabouensis TaxID=2484903 RepID=UPI001EEA9929|nr:hypothetical protein [Leptospira bandrabouensis]MCG6154042.1 hypothetical protein [Leptospira bandrabouensis]
MKRYILLLILTSISNCLTLSRSERQWVEFKVNSDKQFNCTIYTDEGRFFLSQNRKFKKFLMTRSKNDISIKISDKQNNKFEKILKTELDWPKYILGNTILIPISYGIGFLIDPLNNESYTINNSDLTEYCTD